MTATLPSRSLPISPSDRCGGCPKGETRAAPKTHRWRDKPMAEGFPPGLEDQVGYDLLEFVVEARRCPPLGPHGLRARPAPRRDRRHGILLSPGLGGDVFRDGLGMVLDGQPYHVAGPLLGGGRRSRLGFTHHGFCFLHGPHPARPELMRERSALVRGPG